MITVDDRTLKITLKVKCSRKGYLEQASCFKIGSGKAYLELPGKWEGSPRKTLSPNFPEFALKEEKSGLKTYQRVENVQDTEAFTIRGPQLYPNCDNRCS